MYIFDISLFCYCSLNTVLTMKPAEKTSPPFLPMKKYSMPTGKFLYVYWLNCLTFVILVS